MLLNIEGSADYEFIPSFKSNLTDDENLETNSAFNLTSCESTTSLTDCFHHTYDTTTKQVIEVASYRTQITHFPCVSP